MGFAKSMEDGGPYRLENGQVVRARQNHNPYRSLYDEARDHLPAASATDAKARALEEDAEFAENQMSGLNMLVPLLYAPLLPAMRLGLRNRVPPERLTQLTLGVVAVALAHAGSIMASDSSVALRK